MAPNGHASSDQPNVDRRPRPNSRPVWHERHGSAEFRAWKVEHPKQHISYDDWKVSSHVDGFSLYYAALQIWEESESSDDNVEQPEVEPLPRGLRGLAGRNPKMPLGSNGHGVPRAGGSATPSASANFEDQTTSGKKKRKSKKKYVSEEFVASDGDSGVIGMATPYRESPMPSAPIITVNGRRKSSTRKPKRKPLSDEIVSPEDEQDDPMSVDRVAAPAIASPLPVRSAPGLPNARTTGSPKKTILKLNTRKAPKKKILSEETVFDDDTDEGSATIAVVPAPASVSPNVTAVTTPHNNAIPQHTPANVNDGTIGNDASASPDQESVSAAATRRGLRARRPAQQRPYSVDAEIYEEHDTDVPQEYAVIQPSSDVHSRRVSVASIGKGYLKDLPVDNLDEETLAILQGEVEPEFERADGRPKHFKGKGRAWKKEESDEDLEFNPGKKKAARAKAAKARGQQPKKRGRPRKSNLSEDVVRDDSDAEELDQTEEADTVHSHSPAAPEVVTRKSQRPTRKSVLSAEVVRDDTDEDDNENKEKNFTIKTSTLEITTPAGNRRSRPRTSEQTVTSKISTGTRVDQEEAISYTPKGTPTKSYTPQGTPTQSYTPRGEPKQPVHVKQDEPSGTDSADEPMDISHSGIEDHMASVNMDSEEELYGRYY